VSALTASRGLATLERELRVRLMQRTTRALSLTAEGEAFLPYARDMIEQEALGRQAMVGHGQASSCVTGLLRVSATLPFGRKVIAPLLPELMAAHPRLRLSLHLSDAQPDLIASGFDLAIRIARLKDSRLIAQKIIDNPRLLVASPAYLNQHGRPETLDDLKGHACLGLEGRTHWDFTGGTDSALHHRLDGRFVSNSIDACHALSLAGGGISLLSGWNVRDDIEAGRLVALSLSDATPETTAVWAVYPSSRFVPPRVRLFIEAVRQALTGGPDAAERGSVPSGR